MGIEEGVVQLNKIFQWNPETDTIDNISITSKTLTQIANLSGRSINELHKEIENRKIVLKHMVDQEIHTVSAVKGVLDIYYKDSKKVLNRILSNR